MRSLIVKHRQQSRAVYARILTAANSVAGAETAALFKPLFDDAVYGER